MPSQLLARREELVCDGLYAHRHTRLIAAPQTEQKQGQVVPSEPNLAFVTEHYGQMGCGPLKRPECDGGSEQVPLPPCMQAWQAWQPVDVPSPTSQPSSCCTRWVGRGFQYCTVSMDQDWDRLELCIVETTSLGRGQTLVPKDDWASATWPIAATKVRRCISTNQPRAHRH